MSTPERVETANAILHAVGQATGIWPTTFLSRLRTTEVSDARTIAAWELKKAGFTTPEIAAILNRDRTTVLHSFKAYADNYEYCKGFAQKADKVKATLTNNLKP